MNGVKRVLVFCLLIVILPSILIVIPLYLRKFLFADVVYEVAESDIIEIRDGISSIFCQQHSLRMSSHFNAFQVRNRPEISTNHKKIRLKKSMTLPDDTLEYWGFYLLKGAQVDLRFCSRYDGSRILVVKGERNLKTCGLLDHNKDKYGTNFAVGHEKVSVFFSETVQIPHENPDMYKSNKTQKKEHPFNKIKQKWPKEKLDEEELENHAEEDLTDYTTTVAPSGTKARRKHTKHLTTVNQNSVVETDVQNKTETGDITSNNVVKLKSAVDVEGLRNRMKREIVAAETSKKRQKVYDGLFKANPQRRQKRDHVYDRKYSHGGNAVNFTDGDESNSISSFENGLFECYDGQILLAEGFPPSNECLSPHFLENGTHRMVSHHEVIEDGYYYYIFYSDNDLVKNDIHAIFDISKPTFQYSNLSDSQGCINSTNCTFPIGFMSDEIVIVEVPTRDGIEHEEDDITFLYSTCHPRTYVYAIFPISVLVLILSCAFL